MILETTVAKTPITFFTISPAIHRLFRPWTRNPLVCYVPLTGVCLDNLDQAAGCITVMFVLCDTSSLVSRGHHLGTEIEAVLQDSTSI